MTELETQIWNTVHNWCDAQSNEIADQNRRYLMDEMKALVLSHVSKSPAIVGNNVLAPVKFLIRQMNGIQRGELTLDDDTSKLYRDSSYETKTSIRLELCLGASKHFKTDCYVSEVLNGC